ncbi:MAG: twin-arginine translocase subunit TatC [Lentisphaerae bacterium]|nr:twin-arginine translocase subunit TatC [Lentisphaerota bacterium]
MSLKFGGGTTLIEHLSALRQTLIRCITVTGLLFPAGYFASDHVIRLLVRHALPEAMGKLYFFTPMEVFMIQLKLGFVLALAAAYPWNMFQFWKFLLPALYEKERKLLGFLIVFSSLLFFSGAVFCGALILPVLMDFSASFASPELMPMIGLADFLDLAGWMMLAFGLTFQIPVLMIPLVKLGVITTAKLKHLRPYVMTGILIIAGILTPPDIISQLMLAVPAWLLFESGLLLAAKFEK